MNEQFVDNQFAFEHHDLYIVYISIAKIILFNSHHQS